MGQPREILHDTLVQRTFSPRRGWRESVTETITYRRDEANLQPNLNASIFPRRRAQANFQPSAAANLTRTNRREDIVDSIESTLNLMPAP